MQMKATQGYCVSGACHVSAHLMGCKFLQISAKRFKVYLNP